MKAKCENCASDFESRMGGRGMTRCCSRKCSGQLAKKNGTSSLRTHGFGKTKLNYRWLAMRKRCANPNDPNFKNYGARGIKVCEEWAEYLPFHEWAMANGYKDDLELDRIDNDGDYSPTNCRFVTRSVNDQNKRPKGVFKGVTRCCRGKKFKAVVCKNYVKHAGPPRESATQAAQDYDNIAVRLYGPTAKVNFA